MRKGTLMLIIALQATTTFAFDLGGIIGGIANGNASGGDVGGVIGGILSGLQKQTIESRLTAQDDSARDCEDKALQNVESKALSDCTSKFNKSCKILVHAHISRQAELTQPGNSTFTGNAKGGGSNTAAAESDAIAKSEQAAAANCVKATGMHCSIVNPGRILRPAYENPAVTIGGLSGFKYNATAEAVARPDGVSASVYVCEAAATAQSKAGL